MSSIGSLKLNQVVSTSITDTSSGTSISNENIAREGAGKSANSVRLANLQVAIERSNAQNEATRAQGLVVPPFCSLTGRPIDPNTGLVVPRGVGRPKRDKKKMRKKLAGCDSSSDKLKVLKHDPLEELVKLHTSLKGSKKYMEEVRDGKREGKFSAMWYADCLAQIERVNAGLMRYRYARVSETVKVEAVQLPAFGITLTTKETYDHMNDITDVTDENSNE